MGYVDHTRIIIIMANKENNHITIDATYKTTKYDLAFFFLCVKTNVNYTVVAEFVQSESANEIADALTIMESHVDPTFLYERLLRSRANGDQGSFSGVHCILMRLSP